MSKFDLKKFESDGFFVIEDFISKDEADKLREECGLLVDDMNPKEHHSVFSTTSHQNLRNDYFLKSADRIGFFFEEGAVDEEGELKVEKTQAVNKIGHALHVLCPTFRKVTHCEKVEDIARALKYTDPVIMQSMYIFKQPKIGGAVVPHQDATFLNTDPIDRVTGIWIALEDATEENGCLWFWPGSHKSGIYGDYLMVRNPESDGPVCIFKGKNPTYDDKNFVPVPVKKGAAIIIHGLVVHKSAHNYSSKTREIYTFHMYDHGSATWSSKNWLQPTERGTFTHLFTFDK